MHRMKLVDLLFETGFGTSMTQVPPGVGRNAHSVHTDPYTWEDYEDMEYEISTDEKGKTFASITDTTKGRKQSYTRTFADEEQAKMWIRTEFEKMKRDKMAKER